ncbi:MAG: GNAT family N-acetyltransferase [Nanoarchaeota archaeon]|nr:GNAT family N-acetyltransferase [Nanoarchaeota archaeon]MCG2720157.1 GNAT family N-acetyltransferase [Nanoarchaeota archaeon]
MSSGKWLNNFAASCGVFLSHQGIKKSDKEEIYKLTVEENRILQQFMSQPIYKFKFTKRLFEKLFNAYFSKNKFFLGIKEDKKIVAILSGYIKPTPKGDVGYIDNMFVSKKYSGKGFATILRDEFFKWLKGKKIKYCQLNVFEKNPAKHIYEKWGFCIDGLQMTKRL